MSQRGTGGPSDWRVDKNGQEYYDDQRTRTRIYRDAHGEYYIDPQTRRRVYLGARGKQTPRFVPTSASAIPSQQVPPPRSDHGPTGPTQRVPVSQPSSPPQTLRLPILPSSDDQKTTKQASYQLKPPSHPTDMTGINAAFGGLAILPASEPGTNRPISGNALGKRPMSNIPPMRTNQALQAIAGAQSASSAALSQPGPSGAPRMDNVASQRQNQILDEEYKLRKHPNKYFKIGKVFLMVHTEPYGQSKRPQQRPATVNTPNPDVFVVAYGELVFSKVRRFVVVREGGDSCQALAISTHSGKGAARNGGPDHGIVYTGPAPPKAYIYEKNILPSAIRVDPEAPTDKLHLSSRLNYGKIYTIEHNVKVKPYGTVNNRFMHTLIHQFMVVFFRTATSNVAIAIRQPTAPNFQALGFTEGQVKAVISMMSKGANASVAISSVARMSAMLPFEGNRQQQELANHVSRLVMAGLTYPRAVEHVQLVEEVEDRTEDNDDDPISEYEEEDDENEEQGGN